MFNEFLFFPQKALLKEERDLNIFIGEKIFGYQNIEIVSCNIDPESGLVDICLNKDRLNYFSKYETILLLPAYLNEEEKISVEEFFDDIVYINDNDKFDTYEKQKRKFLDNTISYNSWHSSSFNLLPNYCDYLELANQVVEYSIENNFFTKNEFIKSLSIILGTDHTFELAMAKAIDKIKAIYYCIEKDTLKKDKKILCFFDRK